jgi:hypothetical protein
MKAGCWSLLAGALVGAVGGGILGALLGVPLTSILGISNFEGESGFFIAFVLIPLFALVGAILGMGVARRRGRRSMVDKVE